MKRKGFAGRTVGLIGSLALCSMLFAVCVSEAADRLVVKDGSNNTKFVVTDAGQVGIGTATPTRNLDVSGGVPIMQNSGTAGFDFKNAGATFAASISVGAAGNPNLYANWLASTNARDDVTKVSWGLRFDVGADKFRLLRAPVGSGFASLLEVLGNGSITSSTGASLSTGGVWTSASSREYKENIKTLTAGEAIDTLKGLEPVKYNYKVDKEEKHVGFIAEDVPDLVATKDRKGLSSMDIVAVLTKVVQEQEKTIAQLKEKVTELERVEKLRAGIASLDIKTR
jgi:hypothetical protein